MRTKIFVMTHKKFDEPQNPIYIPLQVGKAETEDLGYLGDDTGDSISHKNKYYGELTGLYWLWKNYSDVDIIGICHYRRYFSGEGKELLDQEDYEQILSHADIIVSNPMYVEGAYLDYFGEAHHVEDLLAAGDVIRELYPHDYDAFLNVVNGSKYYYGNLCVTTKTIFDDYCEWLFSIFSELEKRVDVSGYDAYHKRLYGFISEQLLLVYITARNLSLYEGKIRYTSEKAETVEFKLAMSQLVKMGEFSQAREMYYQYIQMRPDICLELSDLRKEIPDIELVLYILEQEKLQGEEHFYQISHNLRELIAHLRNIRKIVIRESEYHKLQMEDQQYLEQNHVTEFVKELIRVNL